MGGNEPVCVQIALNYVCFKGFFKSGGLGDVLLGKLANLPCLDIKKILHMESITFHCKQHRNLYFLRLLGSPRPNLKHPPTLHKLAEKRRPFCEGRQEEEKMRTRSPAIVKRGRLEPTTGVEPGSGTRDLLPVLIAISNHSH